MFYNLLQVPIVEAIIDNLDLQSATNLMLSCKNCNSFSYYLYEKFSFRLSKIKNTDKNKIKKLIIDTSAKPNLNDFKFLTTISIECTMFNSILDFIPPSVQHIEIDSIMFNKKIDDIFPNLKTLNISSQVFNGIIEKSLISRLEKLTIISATYTHMNNMSNDKYYISSLISGCNNMLTDIASAFPFLAIAQPSLE